jgi:DNA modification methylase
LKVKDQCISEKFALYCGDCIDVMKGIPDNSIHGEGFSPPFASLIYILRIRIATWGTPERITMSSW